ncbi:MAG TPA: sigma 54-interacting transcriptional regulator [Candidatus Eisenbacteria bacterium]|nr:sigma 54-interacting transcriptional regulator [Candidatus Eisenbacteria bacterium]
MKTDVSSPEIAGTVQANQFGHLVADLAARLVSLPPGEVDEAIVDSQRQIVLALDIDRCVLWQFTENDGDLVYTHTWFRPGLEPPPSTASAKSLFPWFLEKIRANEAVWFHRVDEIPAAFDRENVRPLTMSNAIMPMEVNGRVVGALSFASLRRERVWTDDVLGRLRLVAAVFAQVLARRQSQVDLEHALAEVQRLRDQLAVENVQLRHEVTALKTPRSIAAESPSIQRTLAQVESVAPTDATVLLLGETGSGKEVFAEAIHDQSRRRNRPIVRVNCGAIPTALMESELFGRERGAYTGALSRQVGRFELASGTTIFLDEVGDLPFEAQAKLLRVLQDRTLERLGSTRPIQVDVRVIAATNRDLRKGVAERTFREDLFYRLNVFPIHVPPLRERVEDIPILVWTFVEEFARALGKNIESISKESLTALRQHAWPGNVRELRNAIERAVIVAKGPVLVVDTPRPAHDDASAILNLADLEREHIRGVLDRVRWRVRGESGAAEILGIKPTTLESRMLKLGILRPKS